MRDMKQTFKKALKQVSSLPLTISKFGAIAGFSALGTAIEQNKSYAWYVENYPVSEDAPLFGALDFTFILNNGLDHVYTTWYFLSLLSLLAVSLAVCTATKTTGVLIAKMEVYQETEIFSQLENHGRKRERERCESDGFSKQFSGSRVPSFLERGRSRAVFICV